ncbi:M15 family metallopeptidase [Gordonia sp. CPCC 205333]|uniref:M15 family metallopeptidase n=1 Tax=Gordonia sp. CPCC 205333 TaxID=3140790 RepID=UPI003AF36FE7
MSFRTVYGNTYSENGWRMVNRDSCIVIDDGEIAKQMATAPIRAGTAALVLGAWARWYHEHVEPIIGPVWGWSATNDVSDSNHLSGTALDINAPKYPWGARTMPAQRIAKVRNGLREFEGLVFWGADWDRADEMHYQINGTADQLAAFARRRIRDGQLIGKEEDATMADIEKFIEGYLGPNNSDTKDIRQQLTGSRDLVYVTDKAGRRVVDLAASYKGFAQTGNRTMLDTIAAIAEKVGVPGCYDPKTVR